MEYEIKLPEGQKFRIKGPEGFTQEQAWKELQGHLGQTKDQDPELLGYNLHPEEQGAAGGIYKRAGEQFFPSAARDISETASGLWNIISNPKGAWNALKEQAQSEEGIGGAIWNDISRHYGSVDRAQKTFETDPARFLMDLVTLPAGGAALIRKLGMTIARGGRHALPEIAAAAARETGGTVTPPTAAAFRTAGDVGEAGGQAISRFRAGIRSPTTAPRATTTPERAAGEALGAAGWRPRHITAPSALGAATGFLTGGVIPGSIAGAAGMAASSPRLMGETMLNLGRLQRGAQALPRMRTRGLAAGAELTRAQIQKQATKALKDKDFKSTLDDDQRKAVRKVVRDPNADSKAYQAAQRVLGGYRPLQLTVRPEQGGYGGTEGGQSNDATSGVVSRQEGGPVEPGRAYSVGDAPGASADTPKPETFVPDAPKDYDYSAWEKAGSPKDPDTGHAPDTYKLPNHPTFSNESIYSGKEGAEGGKWSKNPDGSWNFTPGKTNLEHFTPQQLQDYFQRVEPGNHLILPQTKDPHGGEMLGAGKLWDMLLEGGKDLNARLREAGRAAFFEPEAYDPSAPLELAGRIPGRAMLPIKTALGARKLKKETAAQ